MHVGNSLSLNAQIRQQTWGPGLAVVAGGSGFHERSPWQHDMQMHLWNMHLSHAACMKLGCKCHCWLQRKHSWQPSHCSSQHATPDNKYRNFFESTCTSVHLSQWITLLSPAAPSALFGCAGELWDKSRLLDWSYAGYMYGDYQLPKLPAMADVKEVFGAKGDGFADDTAAFELALNMMPQQGTLFLPKGVYVIKRVSWLMSCSAAGEQNCQLGCSCCVCRAAQHHCRLACCEQGLGSTPYLTSTAVSVCVSGHHA